MRPSRFILTRPWEVISGISGLALLTMALVALLSFDPNPPALASSTPNLTPRPQFNQPTTSLLDAYNSLQIETRNSKLESITDNPFATHPVSLKTADLKTYNGKTFRYVKTLTLRVTAYAPDPRCCYPYDGTTTASGLSVTTNGGRLVAADTDLIPLHSLVIVPGYAKDAPVPVLDRGSAIKGHRLDVLLPTFTQAQKWGVHNVQVKIYQPVK